MIRSVFSLILFACAMPVAAAVPPELSAFASKYCFDCHGSKKQKGDFDFEPFVAKVDVMKVGYVVMFAYFAVLSLTFSDGSGTGDYDDPCGSSMRC